MVYLHTFDTHIRESLDFSQCSRDLRRSSHLSNKRELNDGTTTGKRKSANLDFLICFLSILEPFWMSPKTNSNFKSILGARCHSGCWPKFSKNFDKKSLDILDALWWRASYTPLSLSIRRQDGVALLFSRRLIVTLPTTHQLDNSHCATPFLKTWPSFFPFFFSHLAFLPSLERWTSFVIRSKDSGDPGHGERERACTRSVGRSVIKTPARLLGEKSCGHSRPTKWEMRDEWTHGRRSKNDKALHLQDFIKDPLHLILADGVSLWNKETINFRKRKETARYTQLQRTKLKRCTKWSTFWNYQAHSLKLAFPVKFAPE